MTQERVSSSIVPAFGFEATSVHPITDGLINHTYKATRADGKSFIVQKINTNVFPRPDHIMENYDSIYNLLHVHYPLPRVIRTAGGEAFASIDGEVWRCFTFVENSYVPTGALTKDLAYTTALSFGKYTTLLSEASPTLQVILPRFHDLGYRAQQLQDAIKTASSERLKDAKPWLDQYEGFAYLIKQFDYWAGKPDKYPLRILHHDAKPSNILFDSTTHQVICPIDFDTTQTGLFFSDLGDMIRSMVPSHPENEKDTSLLQVRTDILQALLEGYDEATHALWTPEEKEAMHLSGKVLLYMQSMRFLADYLNNDVYYQTSYPGHNLYRAANQCTMLVLLDKAM